ncbi:MAG: glycoside hydrolase [Clostridia bacterium]|nr:glycoside hydrolase [Clostridia bacterium]
MIDAKIKELLLLPDGSPCQVYDRFHVIFRAGESLEVTILEGQPPAGKAIAETQMKLPEGYTLFLSGNKKGFLLKRLSGTQNDAAAAEVAQYRLDLDGSGRITALEQTGKLNANHIWGTGERYHAVDMKGSVSSGAVTEKFTQQGEQAYLPIPFFFTEQGVGCYRESNLPVQMDFRDGFTLRQQAAGSVLAHDFWFFGAPSAILSRFIRRTGQPALPPEWAFGVWISANGWDGDAEVDAQLSALKQYDYPADVMVLEAWSDERTFYRWNDADHWADPEKTVRRIKDAGLHLVLWQIPVIKQMRDGEPGEQLLRDEREAIEKKYCIFKEDGTPYRIPEGVWFNGSLLPDFTNPETVAWWFGKRRHLLDMGVEGFKTDGGEFLLDDTARLYNGMRGREAHNLYPSQYIGAYHDFMKRNGVEGVTFSRADYTGAQTRPIHWAGDQLSLWSELRAQLNAGITAGLSGVLFWSFDIGGFAGELPTAELYLRATALGCFSPIMQWHAEPRSGQFYATHEDGFVNDRSPWNLAEKLHDPAVLTIGTKFAKLRQTLRPYLTREAAFCVKACRPLMAHLCLDWPDDETACACSDQYMLGRSLLVCPILEEGKTSRRVWLPQGEWKHWFTGEAFSGGIWLETNCPLDEIIAFERV